jgi:hypothetical protein
MSKIEIPGSYTAFHILPKDEAESGDERMPKTVAHAMMVFLSTNINNGENGRTCNQCMSSCLKIFAAGPNGNQKISVGQAILCWNCGHVGIPANTDDFPPTKTDGLMPPFAKCSACGETEQTNFVEIRQPDGTVIPFIEMALAPGLASPDSAPASDAAPASGSTGASASSSDA